MKFLLPLGGITDPRFGYLTAPNHKGLIAGIASGCAWGADLGCIDGPEYVKRIDVDATKDWLVKMEPYRATCLFIAGFDVVGDCHRTVVEFNRNAPQFTEWPLAFVAQDWQEKIDFPDPTLWSTLFVGGSTGWKLSRGAHDCIRRAQRLGKHIHIGRVNYWKRYKHFASMEGSDEWTCDGTRSSFEGSERTVKAWAGYMEATVPPRRPVSGSDSAG